MLNNIHLHSTSDDKGDTQRPERENRAPDPKWHTCPPIVDLTLAVAQLPGGPGTVTSPTRRAGRGTLRGIGGRAEPSSKTGGKCHFRPRQQRNRVPGFPARAGTPQGRRCRESARRGPEESTNADVPGRCFARRPGVDRRAARHGNGTRPRRAAGRRGAALPGKFAAPEKVRSHRATSGFARRIRAAGTVGTTPVDRRVGVCGIGTVIPGGVVRGHRASRRPEGLPGRAAPERESSDIDSAPRRHERNILLETVPTRGRNLAGGRTQGITPAEELRSSQKEASGIVTTTVRTAIVKERHVLKDNDAPHSLTFQGEGTAPSFPR